MANSTIQKQLLIIFFFSLIAIALWLFEILTVKTWYSLSWLSGTLYSPFLITFLSALTFLVPFYLNKQLSFKRSILPLIILFAINLFCFIWGKELCYDAYSRFIFLVEADIYVIYLMSFTIHIILGLSYWIVSTLLIRKNKKINFVYISLLILLTIPLCLITIKLIRGLGNGTDWVDAVKMGYPAFWTTFLFGCSGLMVSRQTQLKLP